MWIQCWPALWCPPRCKCWWLHWCDLPHTRMGICSLWSCSWARHHWSHHVVAVRPERARCGITTMFHLQWMFTYYLYTPDTLFCSIFLSGKVINGSNGYEQELTVDGVTVFRSRWFLVSTVGRLWTLDPSPIRFSSVACNFSTAPLMSSATCCRWRFTGLLSSSSSRSRLQENKLRFTDGEDVYKEEKDKRMIMYTRPNA